METLLCVLIRVRRTPIQSLVLRQLNHSQYPQHLLLQWLRLQHSPHSFHRSRLYFIHPDNPCSYSFSPAIIHVMPPSIPSAPSPPPSTSTSIPVVCVSRSITLSCQFPPSFLPPHPPSPPPSFSSCLRYVDCVDTMRSIEDQCRWQEESNHAAVYDEKQRKCNQLLSGRYQVGYTDRHIQLHTHTGNRGCHTTHRVGLYTMYHEEENTI